VKAKIAAVCLVAGVLAGCGGHARQAATTATTAASGSTLAFDYPQSAPLGYTDRGTVERKGSITVHDVSFQSGGHRIDGYLAEGPGKALPGVVLVHGSGGDRRQLVGDAVALAKRGIVAMTISAPSTAYPPPPPTSNRQLIAESKAVTLSDVIAVRRAADALASLKNVDKHRLGYLGWSAGAKTGSFVAASDPRFKALVLLSAGADKLSAFVKAAPAALKPLVKVQLGSVDPLRYVALARPGTLLLEDGRSDEVVPQPALRNMIAAAPSGTVVRWYKAGHALNQAAYLDAFDWLAKKLQAG
jgi:dienelactone hydrolase